MCNATAKRFIRLAASCCFAEINEGESVPVGLIRDELGPFVCTGFASDLLGGRTQSRKDFVLANSAEPVFGIGEIWLSAVHDAVPIAAGGCVNILADRVRIVQKVVQEPQPRDATGCHISIHDRFILKEGGFIEGCEFSRDGSIWLSWPKFTKFGYGNYLPAC
jgi:hypothetical protein